MKTIYILTLIFLHSFNMAAQNVQLTSYSEVVEALINGESLRLVVNYSKTFYPDTSSPSPPQVTGGMEIRNFELFERGSIGNQKAFVSFSENQLILHSQLGHLYNYVKFRIYETDEVEIIARYLDPVTMEVKMDQKYFAFIKSSKNNHAVHIFKRMR